MSSDDTNHEMQAEAHVPLDAEITEYGLEATQQLDMSIQRWICSCGESWDGDERDAAEGHLRSVAPGNDRSGGGAE